MSESAPSFANDIAPVFSDYQAQMAWRFDLTSYDDVKANAGLIYDYINWGPGQPPAMPPEPFPPFSQDFLKLYQAWINTGFGS